MAFFFIWKAEKWYNRTVFLSSFLFSFYLYSWSRSLRIKSDSAFYPYAKNPSKYCQVFLEGEDSNFPIS